jgi:hypothetical protein
VPYCFEDTTTVTTIPYDSKERREWWGVTKGAPDDLKYTRAPYDLGEVKKEQERLKMKVNILDDDVRRLKKRVTDLEEERKPEF